MRSTRYLLAGVTIVLVGACGADVLAEPPLLDEPSLTTTTAGTTTSGAAPSTSVTTEPESSDFFTTLATVPVYVAIDDPAVVPLVDEATDLLAAVLGVDGDVIVPYQVLETVWFDNAYGCIVAFGEPTEEGFFTGYQIELVVGEDVWYVHAPDDAAMAVCAELPDPSPELPLFDTRLLDPVAVTALSAAPVPVLLPVPPEAFQARNPLISDDSYIVAFDVDGASILIWGQRPVAALQPEYWSPVYVEVDLIQEVTFFTPEGVYTLDVECSTAGRDPRCADSRYVESLYASMARFEKSP